ncbi:unnamed protein product [Periconia digitata]|uniref:Uncharacterized protein n=1 Tax=Periconia digitata TaxID=1303443 RepID=A0A9W4U6U0_9PLEO|nr:unnamed protein product [Periconia digitata]
MASKPSTPPTSPAITILSTLRLSLGATLLILPTKTLSLFLITIAPSTPAVLLTRLFGARDAVLGAQLYTAADGTAPDGGRRETRRALWAGIAADALDMCSVAAAVRGGYLGMGPAGLLWGGALVGVGMGWMGLRAVRE